MEISYCVRRIKDCFPRFLGLMYRIRSFEDTPKKFRKISALFKNNTIIPFVMFPRHITLANPEPIPPGGHWSISPEDVKRLKEKDEQLVNIRGQIIASALTIENELDRIISFIFTEEQGLKYRVFKELLLEQEFFTFFKKWQLLKNLIDREMLKLDPNIRKRLIGPLHEIINIRDRFAHGEIVFLGEKPQLEYLKEGKKKHDVLNKSYFEDLENKMSDVFGILIELNKQLTKKAEKVFL